MKLLLLSMLLVQTQGFQVVTNRYGTYLISQGIIKTGPRSWSIADPNNPYRNVPPPPVRTHLDLSQPRQRIFPNLSPTGKTVIIMNPFAGSV